MTRWEIAAPLQRVWDELMSPEQWPTWWRGVEQVDLIRPAGDSHGTGAVRRYVWKSRLPYRLRFTMETMQIVPLSTIEGHASGERRRRRHLAALAF